MSVNSLEECQKKIMCENLTKNKKQIVQHCVTMLSKKANNLSKETIEKIHCNST